MKRFTIALLLLALLLPLASVCHAAETTFEGPGFDSPEAAVSTYIEAFNEGDLEGMLSTFAIETFVERCDSEAILENMYGMFTYDHPEAFPSTNDYVRELKAVSRVQFLTFTLFRQYFVATTQQHLPDQSYLQSFTDEYSVDDFLRDVEQWDASSWFGNIALLEFTGLDSLVRLRNGDTYSTSESIQRIIQQTTQCYGCDEVQYLAPLTEIEGTQYLLVMECARYGDRWYNTDLTSRIAQMAASSSDYYGLAPYEEILARQAEQQTNESDATESN